MSRQSFLITPTPSICKVEQQEGNHGEAAWEQVRSVIQNNKKKNNFQSHLISSFRLHSLFLFYKFTSPYK